MQAKADLMTSQESFHYHLEKAKESQAKLNKIYRETIGLIDSLKNRSRKFMAQVSDIEDGLLSDRATEESMESNIKQLSRDIEEFNRVINERISLFKEELIQIHKHYHASFKFYNGEKGELSQMLQGRKRLMFLDVMFRKFRSKILSLQQMNNILFSFSAELKEVKMEYKQNLSIVNAVLANSMEECQECIKELEKLN